MKSISKRERVLATLAGEEVERMPYGFWGHHPPHDATIEGLVKAQLDWHRQYDMDFMKVMFRSTWCLEDWGCEFDGYHPEVGYWLWTKYPVQKPEDWESLEIFESNHGAFGEQLEVLRGIKSAMPDDAPILVTLFSPLLTAAQLATNAVLFDHMLNYPDALHRGLERIARTMERFTEACFNNGADGVFYATQHASYDLMTDEAYAEFGSRYDAPLLELAASRSIFIMLHLHGTSLMFDLASSLPIDAVNWYDRGVGPSLHEVQEEHDICVIGGIDHENTLVGGTAEEITTEVLDAIEQCGGHRMMISPGCAVHLNTPEKNLRVLERAVRLENQSG